MVKAKQQDQDKSIEILEIEMATVEFCILGRTPLIMNRLSEKARQELLFPGERRNKAELEASLKHDPIYEFRSSVYRSRDGGPTRLHLPSGAFKKAMATAALDIPGATKAQMGRLTDVEGIDVAIYGIPQVFTRPVRQAGINRTPDIRTRAIIENWAARLAIQFARPQLTEKKVANLVGAAGMIVGVGDWRPEKGAGSYGKFACVSLDNVEFNRVIKTGGLKQQDKALAEPAYADYETEELLTWFLAEADRRERHIPSSVDEVIHAVA